jgi:hypothetical protein
VKNTNIPIILGYVRSSYACIYIVYITLFFPLSLNHKNMAKCIIHNIHLPYQDNFLFCLRNRTIWFSRLPGFISRHETAQFGQFTSPHVSLKQEGVNFCNYRGSSGCKWNRRYRRLQGLGCCLSCQEEPTDTRLFFLFVWVFHVSRYAGQHCRRWKLSLFIYANFTLLTFWHRNLTFKF